MIEPIDPTASNATASRETPTDPATRPLTRAEQAEMEACIALGIPYPAPEPPAAPGAPDKE